MDRDHTGEGEMNAGGVAIGDLMASLLEGYNSADPEVRKAIAALYETYRDNEEQGVRIARSILALLDKD